jgi:ABC-2 type transport system permease protein
VIDAVNANSAAIARGYLAQAAAEYNRRLLRGETTTLIAASASGRGRLPAFDLEAEAVVLYNAGLVYPWFFVTGVMSLLLFLNGALVASALAVREKELGTIEQLLMSPAQTVEMLLAKTTPVLILIVMDLLLALLVARLVFGLPVRGSLALLVVAGMLASLAGTGIGIVLATYSSTQQQAQLLTFFLMPPLVLLSGAFAPIESMPAVLRHLSALDPLRYLLVVVRGVTLKGAGFHLLWPPLAILGAFAVILYAVSAWRFRTQLG